MYSVINGVEIPVQNSKKSLDEIVICETCKQDINSEFQQLIKDAPHLDDELVSVTI